MVGVLCPREESVLLIGYAGNDLIQKRAPGSTNKYEITGIFSPNDPSGRYDLP